MLSEALFFVAYLVLLPAVFMSPFAGAVVYEWLQYMPPYAVYNVYTVGNLSFIMGGLALVLWAIKDKKEKPAAIGLIFVFAVYIVWVNITQLTTIVGEAGVTLWDRAVKVLIFTFVLCFMAQTRARIEAFIWVICLAIGNFVVSGAIKTILSGGGGETVVGGAANVIGERVYFATVVSAVIPLGRYLRDNAILVKPSRKLRLFVDGFTLACLLSIIGCQARTGLVTLGVLGIFYFFKSKKKAMYILALPFLLGAMYFVAPPEWFNRMGTVTEYQSDASSMGRVEAWKWGWDFTLQHPITGGGYHSFVMHHVLNNEHHEAFLEAHNMFVETMSDHGFPGLALLILLLLGTFMNCQAIRRRSRGIPELSWASDLAGMLQLAEVTFLAGSMFISDSTLSLPYELIALSVGTRGIVERRLAQDRNVSIREMITPRRQAVAGQLAYAGPAKAAAPGLILPASRSRS